MDAAVIAVRILQYAGICVVGGSALFFRYGWSPASATWPRRLIQVASGLGCAGAVGWLMAQAAALGAGPRDAFDPAMVWSVAADTAFGRAALARAGLFALALGLSSAARPAWTPLALLGLAASASFAWTGHGASDDGWAGAIHRAADVLHLLSAAIWIGALAALAILVTMARRSPSPAAGREVATGLSRFSAIGVAVVAVLTASGLVNSWFLVGLAGLPSLLTTLYGQLLVAKVLLFGLMLGLAAANRYRLAPRLEQALQGAGESGAGLRPVAASVLTETGLALAVLILVSWLGTLSPPIHG